MCRVQPPPTAPSLALYDPQQPSTAPRPGLGPHPCSPIVSRPHPHRQPSPTHPHPPPPPRPTPTLTSPTALTHFRPSLPTLSRPPSPPPSPPPPPPTHTPTMVQGGVLHHELSNILHALRSGLMNRGHPPTHPDPLPSLPLTNSPHPPWPIFTRPQPPPPPPTQPPTTLTLTSLHQQPSPTRTHPPLTPSNFLSLELRQTPGFCHLGSGHAVGHCAAVQRIPRTHDPSQCES